LLLTCCGFFVVDLVVEGISVVVTFL
jgi:hypothetical protein